APQTRAGAAKSNAHPAPPHPPTTCPVPFILGQDFSTRLFALPGSIPCSPFRLLALLWNTLFFHIRPLTPTPTPNAKCPAFSPGSELFCANGVIWQERMVRAGRIPNRSIPTLNDFIPEVNHDDILSCRQPERRPVAGGADRHEKRRLTL